MGNTMMVRCEEAERKERKKEGGIASTQAERRYS